MVKKKDEGIEKIRNAIEEYIKLHDNQVTFYGDFIALDVEDDNYSGDVTFCYGPKKDVLSLLKHFRKMVKEEKEKPKGEKEVFVNW